MRFMKPKKISPLYKEVLICLLCYPYNYSLFDLVDTFTQRE